MKLGKYIHNDQIKLDIKAKNRRTVLSKLVNILSEKYHFSDNEKIVDLLIKREESLSTGIGRGVALPHIHSEDKRNICLEMNVQLYFGEYFFT